MLFMASRAYSRLTSATILLLGTGFIPAAQNDTAGEEQP